MTFIAQELKHAFSEVELFDQIAKLEGQVFREVPGRKTFRFVLDGNAYFAKVHFGVGWAEIFKNLLQLKLPVLGATNEWRAIKKLKALNIDTLTPVAYCRSGSNPAEIRSAIVTAALDKTVSLEDLVLDNRLTDSLRRRLVVRIGHIAKALHDNGINHRDFYICHFLIPIEAIEKECADTLHLIDLHRVQIRNKSAPRRWREKDIAGLLFSAADAGLTQRDLLRFVRMYHGSLRDLKSHQQFWQAVVKRAKLLYQKDHGKESVFLNDLVSKL